MKLSKEITTIVILFTLLSFTDIFIIYYFVIDTYLTYNNLIISAIVWILLNASNVLSLPIPFIFRRMKNVRINVITFSVLAFIIIFTLSLNQGLVKELVLITLFDFLILLSMRSLGYYARTILSKYSEFINYDSILEFSSFIVYIVALTIVGVFNTYLSHTYLQIMGLPLLIAVILSAKLGNVEISLSSTNSFKVWLNYIKSNKVFKFLETRLYPIIALSSALSVLFIKLVYVSEQTFPEFISIVLVASFIAQAIGAVLASKWKSYSAVRLLLLSLPAISTEYVFPFIRGEIIPITALTFLESIVVAYVFIHIRSIYMYIVSKDVYVNISVVQGVLTQASASAMTIIISASATLIGLTYTYLITASIIMLIVLLTIFSSTTKNIKMGEQD